MKDKSQELQIVEKNPDKLLVIGAGLPRTGTLSMKSALTILLKGKCYHMAEHFAGDQEHMDIWMNAIKASNTSEQWTQFFKKKGYVAGVDFPISLFWKELSDAYPEAKIILTTRTPETWYTSVKNSIWHFHENLRNSWTFKKTMVLLDGRKGADKWIDSVETKKPYGMKMNLFEAISGGPEVATQFYKDWEEVVKANIPEERLLVHSAKEGWEPLCKFLDVPVPEESYPNLNDTASIQQAVKSLKMISVGLFYVAPAVLTALATYLFM